MQDKPIPASPPKSLSIEQQAGVWLAGFLAGFTESQVGMVAPEISVHEFYQHGFHCGTLFRLGEIYENQAKRAAGVLIRKKFGITIKVA